MARTRGPGNLVARRPTTAARTYADAHQSYAAMIEQDLGGRRATGYRAVDDGPPPSTLILMLHPLPLFMFACLARVIALLLCLWQAGVSGSDADDDWTWRAMGIKPSDGCAIVIRNAMKNG